MVCFAGADVLFKWLVWFHRWDEINYGRHHHRRRTAGPSYTRLLHRRRLDTRYVGVGPTPRHRRRPGRVRRRRCRSVSRWDGHGMSLNRRGRRRSTASCPCRAGRYGPSVFRWSSKNLRRPTWRWTSAVGEDLPRCLWTWWWSRRRRRLSRRRPRRARTAAATSTWTARRRTVSAGWSGWINLRYRRPWTDRRSPTVAEVYFNRRRTSRRRRRPWNSTRSYRATVAVDRRRWVGWWLDSRGRRTPGCVVAGSRVNAVDAAAVPTARRRESFLDVGSATGSAASNGVLASRAACAASRRCSTTVWTARTRTTAGEAARLTTRARAASDLDAACAGRWWRHWRRPSSRVSVATARSSVPPTPSRPATTRAPRRGAAAAGGPPAKRPRAARPAACWPSPRARAPESTPSLHLNFDPQACHVIVDSSPRAVEHSRRSKTMVGFFSLSRRKRTGSARCFSAVTSRHWIDLKDLVHGETLETGAAAHHGRLERF